MSKIKYLSQIFQPLITVPKGAQLKNTEITCKSQKLLWECGLVRSTAPGLFALMPLAQRALDKLEGILIKHFESIGAQRISLPALSPQSLWDRTGRSAGAELLVTQDRHRTNYLLAPTHEEGIADLLAENGPLSYKQLPLLLYQIGAKYRDERRPKHGLMRAREFRMLDAYGAHTEMSCAKETYSRVTKIYSEIFKELQLPTYAVEADSGDMGGSISHEWQVLAAAGEDVAAVCGKCGSCNAVDCTHSEDTGRRLCLRCGTEMHTHSTIEVVVAAICGKCGSCNAVDCTHSEDTERRLCLRCGTEMHTHCTIEVGHTFILGTRYSAPLGALYTPPQGGPQPVVMTCYGIGTTRLLAASVEALSDDSSIRWANGIAPYDVIVIGPKEGSKEWQAGGWERAQALADKANVGGTDVLVDDRHALTVGKRLMMAKKLGYPNIIVCGRATLESTPRYELHRVGRQGKEELCTESELLCVLGGNRGNETQDREVNIA